MSAVRTVGVGVLVVLLTASLVGANGVVAAERTVLSAGFVKTTIDENDGYDVIQEAVVDAATGQEGGEGLVAEDLPVAPTTIVESAVTEDFLRSQTERNVERIYAYLHGGRSDLVIAVDLRPVKANIVEAVETQVEELPLSEMISLVADDEMGSVTIQGVTMDVETIATMAENRSSYRSVREDFREQVRSAVLDRLVNQTMAAASDDELLALVIDEYDPTAYTDAEKASMVQEREPEIRAALARRIEEERGDELEAEIDRQLADYNDELTTRLETTIRDSSGDMDPAVANATVELATIGVDGLTTDMPYSTFEAEVASAKSRLAAAVAGLARAELAENVPDRLDLTDEMDPQTAQQLRAARSAVGIADDLVYALPAIAVLLVAGLYLLSGSLVLTTIGSGIGLSGAGLLGLGLASLLPPRMRAAMSEQLPAGIASLVSGLIGDVFGVLQTQSLAILVLGVVAVGGGLALRNGVGTSGSESE